MNKVPSLSSYSLYKKRYLIGSSKVVKIVARFNALILAYIINKIYKTILKQEKKNIKCVFLP